MIQDGCRFFFFEDEKKKRIYYDTAGGDEMYVRTYRATTHSM